TIPKYNFLLFMIKQFSKKFHFLFNFLDSVSGFTGDAILSRSLTDCFFKRCLELSGAFVAGRLGHFSNRHIGGDEKLPRCVHTARDEVLKGADARYLLESASQLIFVQVETAGDVPERQGAAMVFFHIEFDFLDGMFPVMECSRLAVFHGSADQRQYQADQVTHRLFCMRLRFFFLQTDKQGFKRVQVADWNNRGPVRKGRGKESVPTKSQSVSALLFRGWIPQLMPGSRRND